MQTYPTKSGRGYFFAGLLFALILGACSYWMLHKEQILAEKTAPRCSASFPSCAVISSTSQIKKAPQERCSIVF